VKEQGERKGESRRGREELGEYEQPRRPKCNKAIRRMRKKRRRQACDLSPQQQEDSISLAGKIVYVAGGKSLRERERSQLSSREAGMNALEHALAKQKRKGWRPWFPYLPGCKTFRIATDLSACLLSHKAEGRSRKRIGIEEKGRKKKEGGYPNIKWFSKTGGRNKESALHFVLGGSGLRQVNH